MISCCKPFEKGMQEITAQQIYCERQSAAPLFTAPQFENCPWCGKKIIFEDRRKINESVGNERRKDVNLSSPYTKVNSGFPIKINENNND